MLGLFHRLRLFQNGEEVVNYFVEATSKSEQSQQRGTPQCKVALLILNINLPVLNGNEAMVKVMELYSQNE